MKDDNPEKMEEMCAIAVSLQPKGRRGRKGRDANAKGANFKRRITYNNV